MKAPLDEAPEITPASRASLTGTVSEQLAGLIIGNRLGPGAKLPPERELARRLEVSRLVVREALRSLAERGLVEVKPGVGTFVVAMPQSAVTGPLSLYIKRNRVGLAHLFELRSVLEPAIASAAARSAEDADLEVLAENLRRTEGLCERIAAGEAAAIEEFAWADLEFHQLLARASRNPLYQIVLEPLIDRQLEVRREGARVSGAAMQALKGHQQVYRSVTTGDAEAAAKAMERHLATVASLLSATERPTTAAAAEAPIAPPQAHEPTEEE